MSALTENERRQLIEELHRARHGFGLAASFDAEARELSRTCGDEITVRLALADGVVTAFSWEGHGCTVSMASASALAELAPGMPVAGVVALAEAFFASLAPDGGAHVGTPVDPPGVSLGASEAFAGIGRYPLRAGCASLAWRAALAAIG